MIFCKENGMVKKISHLNEEQIIGAAMDQTGLDQDLRRHLLECPVCIAEKKALKGRLERFGQISRQNTPVNFRKPRLSENIPRVFRPILGIRPALGLGLAFTSLLAVLLSPLTLKRDRVYTLETVYQEMLQDEKFMTEIEKLEEDPLPKFYVDITAPDDDDADTKSPGVMKDDSLTEDGGSRNA